MVKIEITNEYQNEIDNLNAQINTLDDNLADTERDKNLEIEEKETELEELKGELLDVKEKNESLKEESEGFMEAAKDIKKYIMTEYWDNKELPEYLHNIEAEVDQMFDRLNYEKIQCENCYKTIEWGKRYIFSQVLKSGFCCKDCKQIFRLKE